MHKAKPGVPRDIPLLRTVFERFRNTPINIDVKVDSDVLIQKISNLIEEFNRRDITVWGSFSDEINLKCRAVNSKIATFFPIKRTIFTLAAYYIGLLPFLPLPDGFFEVPLVPLFGLVRLYSTNLLSNSSNFPLAECRMLLSTLNLEQPEFQAF